MRVLSIDPGYGRCGMAIVEHGRAGKNILIHSECVETSARSTFPERLANVIAAYEHLIERFAPDQVALERLFFSGNQKTAMHVAEVRGALIQSATARGIEVYEYTPAQIKNAAGGWGNADKRQVITMLHMLIQINKSIKHDDEYDAIAVGVTHLAMARARTYTH
ncbi:MAG TPA: crossover junction endodeoxyribonuclease RuvC [Candidatus Paceibacterota bacterium]|nr:crossover junction endodeoxyribonuclease RuvC [Candidatus Paceibacterota bacterium]